MRTDFPARVGAKAGAFSTLFNLDVVPHAMDAIAIHQLACRLRTCFEGMPADELPRDLRGFPVGACSAAALMLGALLSDHGYPDFELVFADRGSRENGDYETHAWLEGGGFIVDITADQFPDGPGPDVVAAESPWHQLFCVTGKDAADFRHYPLATVVELHRTYTCLQRRLPGIR